MEKTYNRKDKVYWFMDSEANKKYPITTWYRCMGITQFIRKVEKENKIVGLIIPDGEDDRNNIGFILDKLK
jgi:hypothetical protein